MVKGHFWVNVDYVTFAHIVYIVEQLFEKEKRKKYGTISLMLVHWQRRPLIDADGNVWNSCKHSLFIAATCIEFNGEHCMDATVHTTVRIGNDQLKPTD